MPEHLNEQGQNRTKVIQEIVAFRYSNEKNLMLVGEAEVAIEILYGDETKTNTNLYSARVDILSAYESDGRDAYILVMGDPMLRQALEKAALEHYFHPPKIPVGLPKKISEW